MGKSLVLHLLAVVAGWGIVAALRPVVVVGQDGRQAAIGNPAPAKSSIRTCNPAENEAGKQFLKRLTTLLAGGAPGPDLSQTVSFQERIDMHRRVTGFDAAAPAPRWPDEAAAAENYQRILSELLEGYLDGEAGPDFSHAFRHGRLEAQVIYESLSPHLPGAAADDTLRIALYQQLAPLDPVRAEVLLHPLSEAAATVVKYETLQPPRSVFAPRKAEFTPDHVFEMLSSIPAPTDGSARLLHELAWIRGTDGFVETYGSDYLQWVEQLPAGNDRDWVTVALLRHLQESDLPIYRRMRALVTDPRM